MATARKRLAKNFQFRLDRRTIGHYNARQDGQEAAARDRLQPCALRSPSGSRERKKETKDALSQLELEAVAENEHALALYRSVGFAEYGRSPKGFRSRISGWQEVVLMRLEL
jgi:hypothetical protein